MARFKRNGGILLDFQEYMRAEHEGRQPLAENLMCGGPRQKLQTHHSTGGRGRGGARGSGGSGRFPQRGGRGGSSRGSFAAGSGGSHHTQGGTERGGRGRGRGRGGRGAATARGGSDSDPKGRGGSVVGTRDGRTKVNRKVEGSDGSMTLKGQFQFEIQKKKGGRSRKSSSIAKEGEEELETGHTEEGHMEENTE
mmetsp:Transcript_16367/g.35681  ORF Transcript_16367/g.35681 Transcript_16367/m.35681 type:complete len:195 (+) Transcript_16367:167-751(+)